MSNIIKFIRGAEADIPVLNQGEPAFTTDTHKVFIGDGAENHQLAMLEDVGEANTASNIGDQVEIFKQKSTYDLEFRTLKAGSSKITIASSSAGDTPEAKETYNTGDNDWQPTHATQWLGQTFSHSLNFYITSVKLLIYRVGTPGTLTVEIRATSAGLPTSTVITSNTINGDDLTEATAGEWKEIILPEVELIADTTYAIVIYANCVYTTSIKWRIDTTGTYANGAWVRSYDNSSWEVVGADYDMLFEVWGKASTPLDYINFDVDAEAVLADLTLTEADISDLGSYLENIVEDTTPQLGGNLDLNGFNISIAGALSSDHTYVGIIDSKNVGESVVFGDLLYFDWTATEWKKAKADAAATTPAMRIALETKGDGEACLMLVQGYIRDDSAFQFTASIGYLSITTAGAIQYAVPTVTGNQVQRVGIGISADIMYFNPSIDVGEI